MFGIVRPCRHRLRDDLMVQWTAHLCGLCLALRADHGQAARAATNYDGLIVSVLVEAQSRNPEGRRRTAGPCPLRGMRTAEVARGEGARLAAAVSLVLASARIRDHVVDGDGLLARRPVAAAARRIAGRWDRSGSRAAAAVGFDTAVLTDAVDRQGGIEAAAGPGTPLTAVTEPAESATAAAFGHTAVLTGRPENVTPLQEAGRFFGRLAHLLDAVQDQEHDAASGLWNPITATGADPAGVRRLCDEAVHGVRLALREAEFVDGRLVHLLLAHELKRSVDRAFPAPGHSCHEEVRNADGDRSGSPWVTEGPRTPGAPGRPPSGPRRRALVAGCAVWTGLFCTGQVCCRDSYEDPWTGKRREGWCHKCDCDCCDGCDCCGCDC